MAVTAKRFREKAPPQQRTLSKIKFKTFKKESSWQIQCAFAPLKKTASSTSRF
jgi:hypothetical protein